MGLMLGMNVSRQRRYGEESFDGIYSPFVKASGDKSSDMT